ncbi:MAG: hypothetical protein ACLFUJ_00285 [Phycisphaerae bacterium]
MKRTLTVLFILAMFSPLIAGAQNADSLALQKQAQRKLLAYRAARADAIRKLAERIKGLELASQTTVEDFVTTSDRIVSSLDTFLNGMKEIDKAKHFDDGTCEVIMEVKVAELIEELKTYHKTYYKGDKITIRQIEELNTRVDTKVFREVGQGAAPEALESPEQLPLQPGGRVNLSNLDKSTVEFWMSHVTGRGRLMAERAARVDAMRRLAERIKGVHITATTTVQDFVAESDVVNLDTRAFIRGAREVGIRYYDDELIVEVEMTIKLRQLLASVKSWSQMHYKGDKSNIRHLENRILEVEDKEITEVGMGTPPADYLKKDSVTAADQMVIETAQTAPMWVNEELTVIGQAALDPERPAAQAKLMAFRAAELDGRRKLAERINGLQITSQTTVEDFVAKSDQIRTMMHTFQQGVGVVEGSQKVLDDGTVEVTVGVDLRPLWNMILHYQKQLNIKLR